MEHGWLLANNNLPILTLNTDWTGTNNESLLLRVY